MERLADDREQEECRYLMRFWWQMAMTYREVTLDELREHVGGVKFAAVEAFLVAAERDPEAIEEWIRTTTETFPFIYDRGSPE